MTDAEIIKALEYCCGSIQNDCKDCPFGERCENDESLLRYAFDLIDRKTEEICVLYDALESEQYKVHELSEERDKLLKECKKCGRKHGRKVSNMQKEIERLKCTAKHHGERVGSLIYHLEHAKSEAYREFANLLKAKKFTHTNLGELVYVEDIDNTLDELTGGINNEKN